MAENQNPKAENVIRRVPIVAIRGSVVFPHTDNLLTFGRPKSVSAINSAFQEDKVVAIFTQKDSKLSDPTEEDLYKVGTIATITQMMSADGEVHVLVRGQTRIKLKEMMAHEPFMMGKVVELQEKLGNKEKVKALSNKMVSQFRKAINLGKQAEIMTVMSIVSGNTEPGELVDQVTSLLVIKVAEKHKILSNLVIEYRIDRFIIHIVHKTNILDIEKSITSKTQKRFEDQMRKAMLREKKKTIEEELGEDIGDLSTEEASLYKKKITKAKMPKEVAKKAKKELKRLIQMSPNNPETGYIRNFLDWLTDMPWSKKSPNNVPIAKASKILQEDHYGLKKAKERILEYLSVMKIKAELEKKSKKSKKKSEKVESQPTILCFIGPPGVGKTSIGKSIARSMGREFVRISLGGIRDEAEIRGHRRTYVGALPGRIIQGVKNAGTKNPVFMLDEIDKIGVDFRGDPSSALLEALDPEQNREFSDHYLEVPFDLSEVMFICTGNVLENIPGPLKDRMEVISFPGYTQDEKYHIADDFLWPKQVRVHGLESKKIKIGEDALNEVINRYTREAGVRNLERNLATICRKIARLVAERKKFPKTVTKKDVRKLLGPQQFSSLIAEKKDEVGMSTGLAVTAAGGEILFVEVALMPGKGKLTLTGQLGDVMKESARAAFTWSKAHWRELGLTEDFGAKIDVHIHVPEGAVPKDGPSAGIALGTALVSALTGVPVKRGVGMTGEITLRGRVLEIGGVKEKVIAAHRAGLKKIVLPKDNKKDMEDIPKNIQKDIDFVFASNFEEVLFVAMKKWPIVKNQSVKADPIRPAILTAN